jgi:hypothetical protein
MRNAPSTCSKNFIAIRIVIERSLTIGSGLKN